MTNNIYFKLVITRDRSSAGACWPYELFYEKGNIVKAVEGSLGIFVSPTLKAAYEYAGPLIERGTLLVLKVRGIGEPTVPKYIGTHLRQFYNSKMEEYRMETPNDTLCFPEVEILE